MRPLVVALQFFSCLAVAAADNSQHIQSSRVVLDLPLVGGLQEINVTDLKNDLETVVLPPPIWKSIKGRIPPNVSSMLDDITRKDLLNITILGESTYSPDLRSVDDRRTLLLVDIKVAQLSIRTSELIDICMVEYSDSVRRLDTCTNRTVEGRTVAWRSMTARDIADALSCAFMTVNGTETSLAQRVLCGSDVVQCQGLPADRASTGNVQSRETLLRTMCTPGSQNSHRELDIDPPCEWVCMPSRRHSAVDGMIVRWKKKLNMIGISNVCTGAVTVIAGSYLLLKLCIRCFPSCQWKIAKSLLNIEPLATEVGHRQDRQNGQGRNEPSIPEELFIQTVPAALTLCMRMHNHLEALLPANSGLLTLEQYESVCVSASEDGTTSGMFLLYQILRQNGNEKKFLKLMRTFGSQTSLSNWSGSGTLPPQSASVSTFSLAANYTEPKLPTASSRTAGGLGEGLVTQEVETNLFDETSFSSESLQVEPNPFSINSGVGLGDNGMSPYRLGVELLEHVLERKIITDMDYVYLVDLESARGPGSGVPAWVLQMIIRRRKTVRSFKRFVAEQKHMAQ